MSKPTLPTPKPDPMIARDLVGYGEFPPRPAWPGGSHIAVNFNLNIEGGGESTLANGDVVSEGSLNDIGVSAQIGRRVPLVESVFEYGSRRGAWRLLDVFAEHAIRVSVLGVVRALEQNPELTMACVKRGHEIVSHGYRWIDYGAVPEEIEREHVRLAVEGLTKLVGERPLGWMTGRPGPNTRRLLCDAGGLLYDRDSLADELPYWLTIATHLPTSCPIGCTCRAARILSSPTPTKPTTIVSTRRAGSRPATISSPTCAMPSTCFIARA